MLKSTLTKALLIFILGFSINAFWNQRQHPMQPLYVDIYNGTTSTLAEVSIQHGKAKLQEHIQVLQIDAGEHRIISLNNDPGLGFNIETVLADGTTLTICAGKGEGQFVRATITSQGIIPYPIR